MFDIDFQWPRSTYEFRPPKQAAAVPAPKMWLNPSPDIGWVVAKGTPKLTKVTPLAMEMATSMLVKLEKIPLEKAALTLTRTLGMLGRQSKVGDTESPAVWRNLANDLRGIFDAQTVVNDRKIAWGDDAIIAKVGVYLAGDGRKGTSLAFRPTNLREALILHVARSIAAGTEMKLCLTCSTPMLTGGGRSPHKKKAGSRWCDNKCKSTWHNKMNRG